MFLKVSGKIGFLLKPYILLYLRQFSHHTIDQ